MAVSKPRPISWSRGPIVDSDGKPTPEMLRLIRDLVSKTDPALTQLGKLVSTDQIAADGAGSPLAGGKRGFIALDANSRLAGTKRATAALASYTPTTQPLTQSGTTTTINVAASTQRFPDGDVAYNSGSVDPGAYGTYFVTADDPTFLGGAVAYQASTSNPNVTANDGRLYLGKITTTGGGGGVGGGGGGGACFSAGTLVLTRRGCVPISEIREGDQVLSLAGWRRVMKLLEHDYDGPLCRMEDGQHVTPGHRLYKDGEWVAADTIFPGQPMPYWGTIYNLQLEAGMSDEMHCFALANGQIAHNVFKN